MKVLTVRLFLASVLLLTALCRVGYAQQLTTPRQATQPADDPLIGAWKLDIDKSTNPTTDAEILTIAPHGDQFQIIFQAMQSNGYNPHYQLITDMKGATTKLVQTDGKPMSDEWRVTRSQPNAFVVESVGPFGGWKKEYAVTADGKTLTVHELPGNPKIIGGKMDSDGVIHRVQQVLVFEKISESEARSLTQKMADSAAAPRAVASGKSVALAASDATACGVAPGQTGAPESFANQSAWHEYTCPKDGFAISLPNAPEKQSLQRSNFYKLFMTQDESIVVQLWVSAEPVDCTAWLRELRALVNRPLPPGAIPATTEATFQGHPAFETVDTHTNGPTYLLNDVNQCLGNRTYRFHARWLTGHPKPDKINRIFDSFSLLPTENDQ